MEITKKNLKIGTRVEFNTDNLIGRGTIVAINYHRYRIELDKDMENYNRGWILGLNDDKRYWGTDVSGITKIISNAETFEELLS
jgi:hypothetical protein